MSHTLQLDGVVLTESILGRAKFVLLSFIPSLDVLKQNLGFRVFAVLLCYDYLG